MTSNARSVTLLAFTGYGDYLKDFILNKSHNYTKWANLKDTGPLEHIFSPSVSFKRNGPVHNIYFYLVIYCIIYIAIVLEMYSI